MAEDEAYRHRLLQQQEQEDQVGEDSGEDEDLQMITSPFVHHHEENGNANGEPPRRWSRTRSGRPGRTSPKRLFGPVRSIFCPLRARVGLFLGLLTLLLAFAFWTIKTPALPPVTDNVTDNNIFKVSFARFKAKLE